MTDKKKFEEEESLGYRIEVVGRNIQVTDAMRAHIWDKISKIERFHNHIMFVHIALEIHRMEHVCTIVVKFDHFKVTSHAKSSDIYISIDRSMDRMQTLLARYKSRIQDHHKKGRSVVDMEVNVLQRPYSDLEEINAEIEEANFEQELKEYQPPKVIGSETKPLKTLTLDEAVMKMDLSGDHFLIFRREEDGALSVLYRRTDKNYGLIKTQ